MKCDTCDEPVDFLVYAAYDTEPLAIHPGLARYPAAMMRTCRDCLAGLLVADANRGFSTKQWVVSKQ